MESTYIILGASMEEKRNEVIEILKNTKDEKLINLISGIISGYSNKSKK